MHTQLHTKKRHFTQSIKQTDKKKLKLKLKSKKKLIATQNLHGGAAPGTVTNTIKTQPYDGF